MNKQYFMKLSIKNGFLIKNLKIKKFQLKLFETIDLFNIITYL